MSATSAALPTEAELRLAVPEKWRGKLKRLPLLIRNSPERARTVHLKASYFDTPEGTLAAAGMNLRIREIGKRRIQTLKIGQGWQAGITERIEIEGWVRDDTPALELIHIPEVRDFLQSDGIWDRLQPGIVTDFRRTSRLVRFDGRFGSALISADLDIGELRLGNRTGPISELELELKEGAPAALYELAAEIHKDVPLRLEYRGKALRAAELGARTEPTASKGKKPALVSGSRINESAVAILKACQGQIAANEAVILQTMAPEGPHQMRVALRRLRAALGMFRAFGDAQLTESVRAEAKWLASALGAAREWDVYLEEIHAPVEAALGQSLPSLMDLRALAEQRQETGYRDARAAVASPRFTAFLLDFGLLIESLQGGAAGAFDHLARSEEFAVARLEKRYRKVRKMGRSALAGPPEAMHDLRLEMKKMRYAAEFFSSLFEVKKAKPFSKGAARLQDLLGYANDFAVATSELEALVDAGQAIAPPNLVKAAGVVIGWHGAEMVRAHRDIADAWNRFLDAGRFWPRPKA